MSSISQSSRPGRTGAKPTPQLPATTVVTPWPLDGSSRLSQLHLTVVVGVDVDESRRDDAAGGVDGFPRLALQPGVGRRPPHHLDDPAILDPDVGEVTRHTGAVDHRATDKLQVEHVATSYRGLAPSALCRADA